MAKFLDMNRIIRRTEEVPEKVHRAVTAIVEVTAVDTMAYAKTHAPWTDDTGAARAGLNTTAVHSPRSHEIYLAHAMDYGIWLEIANNGKYQVIMPTIHEKGKDLMARTEKLMRRIK